jgi:hypothetical protein
MLADLKNNNSKNMNYSNFLLIAHLGLLFSSSSYGQNNSSPPSSNDSIYLRIPTKSQYSEVSQIIGITDITIRYYRPNVNNRIIWGQVLKYDSLWAVGAENATSFHFHDDAKINGNNIQKGDYSFFVIPRKDNIWTIIFNKIPHQHNSYQYNKDDDALRFDVNSKSGPFTESLTFSFANINENDALVRLQWGDKLIEFNIAFDERNIVWNNIENYLSHLQNVSDSIKWHSYLEIANYCLFTKQKSKVEFAINLINQSLNIRETYENLKMKSDLLALKGDYINANKFAKMALDSGSKSGMPLEVALVLKENLKRYHKIIN